MVFWLVLVIAVIVVGLFFLDFRNQSNMVKIVIFIFLGFMLYFGVTNFFSADRVDLSSPKGVVNAIGVYFVWLGHVTGNLWDVGKDTVTLVGNAIKVNNTEDKGKK